MAYNLKNRHFLTLRDFSSQEIAFLLKLAADLKSAKYAGTEVPTLKESVDDFIEIFGKPVDVCLDSELAWPVAA